MLGRVIFAIKNTQSAAPITYVEGEQAAAALAETLSYNTAYHHTYEKVNLLPTNSVKSIMKHGVKRVLIFEGANAGFVQPLYLGVGAGIDNAIKAPQFEITTKTTGLHVVVNHMVHDDPIKITENAKKLWQAHPKYSFFMAAIMLWRNELAQDKRIKFQDIVSQLSLPVVREETPSPNIAAQHYGVNPKFHII